MDPQFKFEREGESNVEGREEEEGSGKREVTRESSAGRVGAVEEVAISES